MEDFLIEVWNDDVRFRFPDPDDDGEDITGDVYTVEVFWRVIFPCGCILHILYNEDKVDGRSTLICKLEQNFFFIRMTELT